MLNYSIGYDMWTVVADTHYSFHIDVNGNKIEVTLSRHKPQYLHGKPHPHSNEYLLQCHHISWRHHWLRYEDIKDIWNVVSLIEGFINEVK